MLEKLVNLRWGVIAASASEVGGFVAVMVFADRRPGRPSVGVSLATLGLLRTRLNLKR